MPKTKISNIHADQHARRILGEDQYKSNRDAVQSIKSDFEAGWEARESSEILHAASYSLGVNVGASTSKSWIAFDVDTAKLFKVLKNPLLLFDNGHICRQDDDHPFAIMTHFFPVPPSPVSKHSAKK